MSVFVDTSAVYALLDAGDSYHERALRATDNLLGEELVTHSYVVAELVSLVRRRLGADAAARLIDDVLPALEITDVDASLRSRALAAFRAAAASDVSLVDRASFEFMRQRGIHRVWAIDSDFATEGFNNHQPTDRDRQHGGHAEVWCSVRGAGSCRGRSHYSWERHRLLTPYARA